MMNWKKWTVWFIVFVAALIALWDVLAIMNGGTEASISHVMIVWSYKYPAFTFGMGFIAGHLFWRVLSTKELLKIADFVKGKSDGDIPKS